MQRPNGVKTQPRLVPASAALSLAPANADASMRRTPSCQPRGIALTHSIYEPYPPLWLRHAGPPGLHLHRVVRPHVGAATRSALALTTCTPGPGVHKTSRCTLYSVGESAPPPVSGQSLHYGLAAVGLGAAAWLLGCILHPLWRATAQCGHGPMRPRTSPRTPNPRGRRLGGRFSFDLDLRDKTALWQERHGVVCAAITTRLQSAPVCESGPFLPLPPSPTVEAVWCLNHPRVGASSPSPSRRSGVCGQLYMGTKVPPSLPGPQATPSPPHHPFDRSAPLEAVHLHGRTLMNRCVGIGRRRGHVIDRPDIAVRHRSHLVRLC